jgi:uncharacterized damage-inducible protein DinB
MSYSTEDGFPYYIDLVENLDFMNLFGSNLNFELLEKISESQSCYRYAPNKWSIKQIVGHITDHERIMCYRILRVSRNDNTALPGYEQDKFILNSRFDELSYLDILSDFKIVRSASNSFIKTLSNQQLNYRMKFWQYDLSVSDLLKATIGHELHHINVLKEKYLVV